MTLTAVEADVAHGFSAPLVADPDPSVRNAALWSVALMNPNSVAKWCRERAADGRIEPFHVRVLGLLGDPQDLDILRAFAESDHELRRAGVWAMGDLGAPAALSHLRTWISDADPDFAEAVLDSLVVMLDETPPGAGDEDEPPDAEEAVDDQESEKEWWNRTQNAASLGSRLLGGNPWPWAGDPTEEPMAHLWRSLLFEPRSELDWLRRQIPDGWLSGLSTDEAIPGE